jgi:RNAse (barnase) inhibitor barstar
MSADVQVEFEFFTENPASTDLAGVTVARITSEIAGKRQLLESLSRQLSFPEYFGQNWDALEESLQDLLPNQGRAIALIHEAIPAQLSPTELKIYLEVLQRVMTQRKKEGEPSLRVFFHNNDRARVTL